jgi:hypothetical protein
LAAYLRQTRQNTLKLLIQISEKVEQEETFEQAINNKYFISNLLYKSN